MVVNMIMIMDLAVRVVVIVCVSKLAAMVVMRVRVAVCHRIVMIMQVSVIMIVRVPVVVAVRVIVAMTMTMTMTMMMGGLLDGGFTLRRVGKIARDTHRLPARGTRRAQAGQMLWGACLTAALGARELNHQTSPYSPPRRLHHT